jgi:hypothetical protein
MNTWAKTDGFNFGGATVILIKEGVWYAYTLVGNSIILRTSEVITPPTSEVNLVTFYWGQPSFEGLKGWLIYEGSSPEGPFLIWKEALYEGGSLTDFEYDTEVEGEVGEVKYFVVVSLNFSGEQSGYSNVVNYTIVSPPPEQPAPINVRIEKRAE